MRRPLLASLVAASLLIVAGADLCGPRKNAYASAPQPSAVPVTWELNIKHGPIERLQMTRDGKETNYWYMRYTVTNNTGKDILFTPDFELMTDTGQVQKAYKDVPKDIVA